MEFFIATLVLGGLVILAALAYNNYYLPYTKQKELEQSQIVELENKIRIEQEKGDKIIAEMKANVDAENARLRADLKKSHQRGEGPGVNQRLAAIKETELRGRRIVDPSPHEVMRSRAVSNLSLNQQEAIRKADLEFEKELKKLKDLFESLK